MKRLWWTKYLQELMDLWAAKDPVKITVVFKENAILTDAFDTKLRSDIKKEIDESLAIANAEPEIEAVLSEELMIFLKNHLILR
jgi:2-oxoisovalerate dehydrogenase E1 component